MTNKERFINGEKFNVWINDFLLTGKSYEFFACYRNGKFISLGPGAPHEDKSPNVIINSDNFVLDFQLVGPVELKTGKIFFKDIKFQQDNE